MHQLHLIGVTRRVPSVGGSPPCAALWLICKEGAGLAFSAAASARVWASQLSCQKRAKSALPSLRLSVLSSTARCLSEQSAAAARPACSLQVDRGWAANHVEYSSLSSSAVLGLFVQLVGGLFVLFANFIELSHVLEEVGASLERDEELRLLAIAAVV